MTALRWVLVILGARALAAKLRALGARLVTDPERESKHYPGLPCDGEPLSLDEACRLGVIRWNYETTTASEPRRSR